MADLVSTLTSMRIKPMPREARKNIYTEHRTVEASEPGPPDNEPTSTPTEAIVEIGDRVMVSYDDPPGQQAVLVVAAEHHDPVMGIFRSSSPTGTALLGKTVDDEVTISVGDQSRSATIVAIDKKELARVNTETPVVRDRTVIHSDPLPERVTTTTSSSLGTPKPVHPEPKMPWTSNQNRRSVEPGRRSGNRIIEELRTLDERFENPRCSSCGGQAHLAITSEGVVIACIECKKNERVDAETLQRLADHLSVICYSCKQGSLKSTERTYGNILRCQNPSCGANNTWQGISERIGKP